MKNRKVLFSIPIVLLVICIGIVIAVLNANNAEAAGTLPTLTIEEFHCDKCDKDAHFMLTYDDTHHWYTCPTCGNGRQFESIHVNVTHENDGICTACGIRVENHTMKTVATPKDGEKHNVEIKCSEKNCTKYNYSTEQEHVGGHNSYGGKCTECDYQFHIRRDQPYDSTSIDDSSHNLLYKCKATGCSQEYVIKENHTKLTQETPATCTNEGKTRNYCMTCDWEKFTPIPATGHKAGTPQVKKPTCTEDGWTITKCKTCNTQMSSSIQKALGHIWSDWTTTKEATCTEAGNEFRECNREGCDAVGNREIPAGHNYKPATCTEPKTCTRCQATEGNPLGHIWSDWTTTKEATCTEAGNEFRECNREGCGAVGNREIVPLGHDYAAATCTKPETCKRCNETKGSALGHTGATHANGGKCTRCQVKYQDHALETSPSDYDKKGTGHTPIYKCTYTGCTVTEKGKEEAHRVTSVTDKGNGTHSGKCTVCQYEVVSDHNYKDGVCTECGAEEPKTECQHTYVRKSNDTQHWEECSKCGQEKSNSREDHTVTKWIDKGNGTHSGKCTVCSREMTKNHNYSDGTCTDCGAEEPKTECQHTYERKMSGNQHWEQCSKCGQEKPNSRENHKVTKWTTNGDGTHSGICTVCSYKVTKLHEYQDGECTDCGALQTEEEECEHEYVMKHDEKQHWQECKKCHVIKANSTKNHNITTYTDNKNGTHSGVCTECNYKVTENHTNGANANCDKCGYVVNNGNNNNNNNNNNNGGNNNNDGKDDTQAGNKIPQTGAYEIAIITSIVGFATIGGISIFKMKKYKNI